MRLSIRRSVGLSDGRSVGRSDGRSVGLSDDRSVCRSVVGRCVSDVRSGYRIVERSLVWSFGRSVRRSADASVGRSFGRSVRRSADPSVGRSVSRVVGRRSDDHFRRSVRLSVALSDCGSVAGSVGRSVGRFTHLRWEVGISYLHFPRECVDSTRVRDEKATKKPAIIIVSVVFVAQIAAPTECRRRGRDGRRERVGREGRRSMSALLPLDERDAYCFASPRALPERQPPRNQLLEVIFSKFRPTRRARSVFPTTHTRRRVFCHEGRWSVSTRCVCVFVCVC